MFMPAETGKNSVYTPRDAIAVRATIVSQDAFKERDKVDLV